MAKVGNSYPKPQPMGTPAPQPAQGGAVGNSYPSPAANAGPAGTSPPPDHSLWTGKTKWAGTKRMGVSYLTDLLYSAFGMNDEDLATDHLASLRKEGIVGEGEDQITEEEAREWLMRGGVDSQSGARGELVKTSVAGIPHPAVLAGNIISPIPEHTGLFGLGGRRDVMNMNVNYVRNARNDIKQRLLMKQRGSDPDVHLGARILPRDMYPLNSDDALSKSTALKPFVNNLDEFDDSQGYWKGINDYIMGGQKRPVMPNANAEEKYPARGY